MGFIAFALANQRVVEQSLMLKYQNNKLVSKMEKKQSGIILSNRASNRG